MKYILDIKQRTRYRVLCFLGYSEYIGVSPKISRDFLTFLLTERTRFLRDRGTGPKVRVLYYAASWLVWIRYLTGLIPANFCLIRLLL